MAVDPNGLEDAFKEEGIGTDAENRAAVGAAIKDNRLQFTGHAKGQADEWVKTGFVTMGGHKYKVDRAIGQLLANLGKISTLESFTEILSFGRDPFAPDDQGNAKGPTGHGRPGSPGWIEAVDISRVAGERMNLSPGRIATDASAAEWTRAKDEVTRGAAKLLAAMPKAMFGVGFTRPGTSAESGKRTVDPDSSHHPFINELQGYSNECSKHDCKPLSASLSRMSSDADAALRPVVGAMLAKVISAYPDGVDHIHVQRPKGLFTR